jgi:FHA domain
MPTCPSGHESTSTDFCDTCGMRIGGAAPATAASAPSAPASAPVSAPSAPQAPAATAEPCPQCSTPRSGQFCEACGYDFASGKGASVPAAGPTFPDLSAPATGSATTPGDGSLPSAPSGPAWTAVVTADRAYFDAVVAAEGPDASALEFPGYCPERRFRLAGREMRIGRRSVSRGLEPEIDLTGPPADPGVSHLHAVLVAEPDGSWSIVDPGSANGTKVNDLELSTGVRTPLHDRDQVYLGAWTMLTIQSA